jgi:ankyrin repeat protein
LRWLRRTSNLPEVRWLLTAGQLELTADVNAFKTSPYGRTTTLIVASMMGHSQVVQELLKHGVDIESKDNDETGLLYTGPASKASRPLSSSC